MKRIISLLLVLAMLLPFCPALADTVYYTLDDFGQAIRRFDDAWADEYTLTVAEGALGSMSDSQLHSFIFRSGCFCLSFRISNIPVTKGGVPCREISIIPRYRPSKAILEAYRSNSTASLTDDEKQVLKLAKSIVTKAKKASKKPIGQEKYIHDELLRRVEEYRGSVASEDHVRRNSCVGALLDGSATNQGYADAFYLLCSMLDMEVKIMSNLLEAKASGYYWNAIKVNDRWVMVDLPNDDSLSLFDEKAPHYAFFNFGADFGLDDYHVWRKGMEPAPIERSSGSEYFYFAKAQPCGAAFADLNSLAQYAYQQRSKSKNNKYIYTLLMGSSITDINDIHQALKNATNKHKRRTEWYVNYVNYGPHCYITIRWDKF